MGEGAGMPGIKSALSYYNRIMECCSRALLTPLLHFSFILFIFFLDISRTEMPASTGERRKG